LATQLDHLYRIRIPASAQLVGTPIATLVQRLRKLRGAATGDDPGLAVARRWLASREPDELARLDLAVFGRGDPNLANRLWHSPNLAFVDWEYSGRTSRVVELADLVEHLQSRETSDATWSTFLEHFDLTLDEEADLLRMRRLMSIYWLLLLQPGHPAAERNSEGSRRAQSERVLALLEGSR
jgi:aminoglycoside phosphotransferase (APT) family kinase protein